MELCVRIGRSLLVVVEHRVEMAGACDAEIAQHVLGGEDALALRGIGGRVVSSLGVVLLLRSTCLAARMPLRCVALAAVL
jgi:hypothetical protein